MKRLLLFSFFIVFPLAAQNFSPSAAAQGITSPSATLLNNFVAPSSILNQSSPTTAGPTNLDQIPVPLGDDTQLLNQTNTAPTPIPEDTPLIIDPALESFRQSQEAQQEQINPIPRPNDTEISPGSVTGEEIGGGSEGAGGTAGETIDTNGGTGINNTAPINNIP